MPATFHTEEEAGPASRKRSYDQITRSQSRSATPERRRSKRRRTLPNTQELPARSYSSDFVTGLSAVGHDPGNAQNIGRSATPSTIVQAREGNTIDLTLDDDEQEDEGDHLPGYSEADQVISNSASTDIRPTDNGIELQRQPRLASTDMASLDPLRSVRDSQFSTRPSSRASHRSDSLVSGPSNLYQRLRQTSRFHHGSSTRSSSASPNAPQARSTRQRPPHLPQSAEVIDLTDDDVNVFVPSPRLPVTIPDSQDDEDEIRNQAVEDRPNAHDDASSDVQITGVRELPPARRGITTLHLSPERLAGHRQVVDPVRRPPNLTRANAQSFSNSQGGFGIGILNQVTQFMRGVIPYRNPGPIDLVGVLDDEDVYDDIQLDHNILDDDLRFEDPTADEIARVDASARAEPAYKAPSKARHGFSRDVGEEADVPVCAGCEDELGVGDDEDVRTQVWVSRKCGHVYCGACNQKRVLTRGGNDRSRKRAKVPKVDELRACAVDTCDVKLTSKTAMFQIYL